MKNRLLQLFTILVTTGIIPSTSVHAQFLKKIMSSVEQTVQNRANNKENQATNNIIDSAFQSKSGNNKTNISPGDTAGISKVLGAFSKAVQQNPNDTSAPDVTMKALGLLTGGGGVSASDSARAINSYHTASGGSGFMYQDITTITSKNITNKDTSTRYITNNGEGRNEMRLNMPGAMSNKMISIGNAKQPRFTVMLYPDTKTFSLNVIDTSLINSNPETYTVTKIGNEKIQGYNCIHSKITSSFNSRFLKSSSTFEVWTSNEVPGYALIKKLTMIENIRPDMMDAIDKAGCGGFFVKMVSTGKDYSMEMLLIKAVEKNLPASLFEIPSGYSESKENMMYHLISNNAK